MKTIKTALIAVALVLVPLGIGAVTAADGPTQETIVVTEPDGIHDCDDTWSETVTRTGTRVEERTRTIPGVLEVSHEESRFQKVTPGQYHEAVTHVEYSYQKSVDDYKTQYEIDKYTRERTREIKWYTYNPGRDDVDNDPFTGPINKDNGWQVDNGNHSGLPQTPVNTVFLHGGGNGSYFYHAVGAWSAWSAPTRWPGNTHLAWVDAVPAANWQDHDGNGNNGDYDRDWTEYPTGATKQVKTGSHFEYSGWVTTPLGAPWTLIDQRTVTDSAAYTDPDVTTYYLTGGGESATLTDANWTTDAPASPWTFIDERKVVDVVAVPESTEKYNVDVEFTYEFTTNYEAGWECVVETTVPEEETTTTTIPVVTTPTTPEPTVPTPTTPTPTVPGPGLPETGGNTGLTLALAAGILAAGAAIWLAARRKTSTI